MKRINGFYWPDSDVECHPVILNQVKDIENVLKYVEKHDMCIQAGGNVGVWPKNLAEVFKTVMTFEPHPENFECLLKNCPEKNIIAHNNALSDVFEYISVKSPNREHDFNCGAYQVFPKGDISTFRIDDLDLHACDLIYLDIEGYELKALKGAIETIKMYHPVIAFEDKELPLMYGKLVGDVEKWLEYLGYEVVERIHRDVICAYTG